VPNGFVVGNDLPGVDKGFFMRLPCAAGFRHEKRFMVPFTSAPHRVSREKIVFLEIPWLSSQKNPEKPSRKTSGERIFPFHDTPGLSAVPPG
jgi:hypothetical protein